MEREEIPSSYGDYKLKALLEFLMNGIKYMLEYVHGSNRLMFMKSFLTWFHNPCDFLYLM